MGFSRQVAVCELFPVGTVPAILPSTLSGECQKNDTRFRGAVLCYLSSPKRLDISTPVMIKPSRTERLAVGGRPTMGLIFWGGTTRSFPSLRRDCPEDDLLGSLAGEMIPYPIGFAEQPRVSYRALGGL